VNTVRNAIFVIIFTGLIGFLGLTSKRQYDKINTLTSQVSKHKEVREKMCNRILSISEEMAQVTLQTPLNIEDSQRLRTDLLAVGAYAEGCVDLPSITKKAMEGCQNGSVDDSLLKEGVWALDEELSVAKKNGWKLYEQKPKL